MRIYAATDELVVRRFWRKKFSVKGTDITGVKVMGGYKYIPPSFMTNLFRKKSSLRYLLIEKGEDSITLDVLRDAGFGDAISWLKRNDWDIEEATHVAIATPFIRIDVSKLKSY